MLHPAAIFDAEQAKNADRYAMDQGITPETLMENAALAVATYITQIFTTCPVLVVCGPGNNGGDGKIVARLLKERGWPVTETTIDAFQPSLLNGKQLVVDAMFGTGLTRDIDGKAKEIVEAINGSGAVVVAIDIASGVNADTGAVMGTAVRAAHTVTFVRPKLGNVLTPGKTLTGRMHIADIGISGENIKPRYLLNVPMIWQNEFPRMRVDSNKYIRGHTLVMGGEIHSTGASRLAAISALRIGSGLVSVACSTASLPIYATALTAVMTKIADNVQDLEKLLEDPRINAVIIGPGCGVSEATRERVLQILSHKKPCVLDADALTSFKTSPKTLFSAIKGPAVLTPHEGEFSRLFSVEGLKPQRALLAAKQSNAVVVLKGNDTVIAAPDGRVAINANAPAWLATAGSGDVLAGMIAGLLAQGMPAWEASCAAVGMHGEAANMLDVGMVAEDLPGALPSVLKFLYGQ